MYRLGFLFTFTLVQIVGAFQANLPGITLPQNCPLTELPDICPNDGITFWLYNSNLETPYQLEINNKKNFESAPFQAGSPIKILIHGFTSNRHTELNMIRPEYLRRGYNVIAVDYGKGALFPCYLEAVHNTKVVANCTSHLVQDLIRHSNVQIDLIHVIGFSLGAQIAGRTGTYLKEESLILNRITGLDPAQPLYKFNKSYLTENSARFVDVIHTSVYGKMLPCGHIEFYFNKDPFQPGCLNNASSFPVAQVCSHQRAFEYFGVSINSPISFFAQPMGPKCTIDKLVLVGEHMQIKDYPYHNYYVRTAAAQPYALGKFCWI